MLAHLRAVPWRLDQDAFKAWRQGLTGYPLVDAGGGACGSSLLVVLLGSGGWIVALFSGDLCSACVCVR